MGHFWGIVVGMRNGLCVLTVCVTISWCRGDALGLDTVLADPGAMLARVRSGVVSELDVARVSRRPPRYRVWAAFPVDVPAQPAIAVALDFAGYAEYFSFVHSARQIEAPPDRVSRHGTWVMEARASVVRTWAIGDIDTVCREDSQAVAVCARQNRDSLLCATHEPPSDGLFTYLLQGIRLVGAVVAMDGDSCRVAVGAEAQLHMPVPLWLYRLVVRVVLPRVLEEFAVAARERDNE